MSRQVPYPGEPIPRCLPWSAIRPAVGRALIAAALLLVSGPVFVLAAEIVLDDGFVLRGRVGPRIASVAENALVTGPNNGVKPIAFVDDGLRRSFVCWRRIRDTVASDGMTEEIIEIPQVTSRHGERISGVGAVVGVTPFDEFGRRTISLATKFGLAHVVQGITEITPTYARVEALAGKNPYIWDMRMATSSIPRATLFDVLSRLHRDDSPDGQLATVRLLLASRRYKDALSELEAAIETFPQLEELDSLRVQLHNQLAEQVLEEIRLRRDAGRYHQARTLLEQFPASQEMAGEILLQVRDLLDEDDRQQKQIEHVVTQVKRHVRAVEDPEIMPVLQAFQRELEQRLTADTLIRMADYLRLMDDETLQAPQKLALALGGWLVGSGSEGTTLNRVASLWEARDIIVPYLRSRGADEAEQRREWRQRLLELEGTTVESVAKLIEHMIPAGIFPEQESDVPGMYRIAADVSAGDQPVHYYVQLPPEYNPLRRYPTLVSLHAAGSSAQFPIEWWAGPYVPSFGERRGQATRHGYIVISPEWALPEQTRYDATAIEHYRVVASLRDAVRRFAIDTDRTYLTGYSSGGDAAWDIGLAHPDLWAGVIPIAATAEYDRSDAPKYVANYWPNARYVPFYFVTGELDADRTIRNAEKQWDRCLKRGFQTVVVEYRGRGHEAFGDELQRMFEWMGVQRREFHPREFEVVAMRPWDNFFWCVEAVGYPARTLVHPLEWDRAKAGAKAETSLKVSENNSVVVNSAADHVRLWLSPDLVDFEKPVTILLNRQTVRESIEPSMEVLLEDVRTRGDRYHPYWARVER